MKNFVFHQSETVESALALSMDSAKSKYIGGGTSLVDLMRENIESPEVVVDVNKLSPAISFTNENQLVIGGAVKNTALASNEFVRTNYPFLSSSILAGASGQIRNMATVAGNVLQRTRCYYFYDSSAACNKRQPGIGCDAIEGFNRIHAILGGSKQCIATHPSDMCVALAALDAQLVLLGPNGNRTISINDFFVLPEENPQRETLLEPNELIFEIKIPYLSFAKNSTYQKVRDRASYAFSIVSIAVALDLGANDVVENLRVAYGGVAPKPWRAYKLEQALKGRSLTDATILEAVSQELEYSESYKHNSFKKELMARLTLDAFNELKKGNS